jgi:non-ribosomal peptide synthetase component E (peptide arylation enzyme)
LTPGLQQVFGMAEWLLNYTHFGDALTYLDERGVAAHVRPDVLAPMTSLPTTAVGKVDKRSIAKQVGD